MFFLPVIYHHPQIAALRAVNYNRELAPAFDLTSLDVHVDWKPVFYTDGSCAFPQVLGGMASAYAVVVDTLQPGTLQSQVASCFRGTGKFPTTLLPVVVAQSPGQQTINRAELCAMIHIAMSVDEADIYTDSQWAKDTFEMVQFNPDFRDHIMRENSDLIFHLCQLSRRKDLGRFSIHKIKSHLGHLSDEEVLLDEMLYHVLGNRVADLAAGRGTLKNASAHNTLSHEIGNWMRYQRTLLTNLQPFLIAAYQQRLDAIQSSSEKMPGRRCFDISAAMDWQPDARSYFTYESVPDKVLRGFLPGASILLCILQWVATLQWPAEEGVSQGISSYELLCHFVGTTHCILPRPVNPGEQYLEYVDVSADGMASLLPESPWEAVRLLESAFTYARRFLGVSPIPGHVGKAQRAYLAMFGYKKHVSGYRCRPVLPFLAEHMHAMTLHVGEHSLQYPQAYQCEAAGPRLVHPLDGTQHKDRLKQFRALQKEMSVRGRLEL
eukprot:Skav209789  [mRNA]  locus=scaffold1201:8609:10087:- [translate_table: standard]